LSKFGSSIAHRAELGQSFIDQVKLPPFDKDDWFRGAYATIQRTLRDGFAPLSIDEKKRCSEMLFSGIAGLGVCSFDQELRQLIVETAREFSLSIGHAQKLLSILCKYALASYLVDPLRLPPRWGELMTNHEMRLPIPIDTIVLFSLKNSHPSKFGDVNAGRTLDKLRDRYSYWATIDESGRPTSWSRLNGFEVYWSLQTRVREIAKGRYLSPLEFEMRYLWIP